MMYDDEEDGDDVVLVWIENWDFNDAFKVISV